MSNQLTTEQMAAQSYNALQQFAQLFQRQQQAIEALKVAVDASRGTAPADMEAVAALQGELKTLREEVEALKAAPPAKKSGRKRKKPNREDYDRVAASDDNAKATDLEEQLDIPASTIRRYRKMTPEEVAELPYLEPHFRDDNGNVVPDDAAGEPVAPPPTGEDLSAMMGFSAPSSHQS